ncbi:hypothetical protein BH09ACT9_BH09ACT9_00390 [soil metagenome]
MGAETMPDWQAITEVFRKMTIAFDEFQAALTVAETNGETK